jgi:hypothetical protein
MGCYLRVVGNQVKSTSFLESNSLGLLGNIV